MPGMDGFEVVRRIREEERQKAKGKRQKAKGKRQKAKGKRQKAKGRKQKLLALRPISIIAVSATAFAEARKRSLEARCDDFLANPFQKEDLLAQLRRHLQLEWIYAEEAKAMGAGDVQPVSAFASGISLPREARSLLLHQAMRGNIKGVLEQLDTIERLGDQFLPLVAQLRTLAKRFEVDEIVELVEGLET
jgi:CheY-like chemotaxis protein